MYTIPIRIPRTFYVDCTLPPDAAEVAALGLGPPLKRTLPGGAEAHFVYQVLCRRGSSHCLPVLAGLGRLKRD